MNQREVTQTSFSTRLKHSGIFATISSGVVGTTQAILGQSQNQIFISSGVELGTTFVTALVNQSIYNILKKHIQESTENIDTATIELISAILVSIFGVGAPRLLLHLHANTEGALYLSGIYSLLNVVVMILYEKKILQKNTVTE